MQIMVRTGPLLTAGLLIVDASGWLALLHWLVLIMLVLACLCLAAMFTKDLVVMLTAEIAERGGLFDFDTFSLLCRRYPMLLYPIFRIQDAMRAKLIGNALFSILDARTHDITDTVTIQD